MEYEQSLTVSSEMADASVQGVKDFVMESAREVVDVVIRLRANSGNPKGRYIVTAAFRLDEPPDSDGEHGVADPTPSMKESLR